MKTEKNIVNNETFFYSDEFVDNPNEIYCDYHFTKDILLNVIKPHNNLIISKDNYKKFKEYLIRDVSKVSTEHIHNGNIMSYLVKVQEKLFPYLEIKYTNRDKVEKYLYYEILLF